MALPPPPNAAPAIRAFHAMAKPAGPDCNLRCAYCFYLEKQALYPSAAPRRMSETVLEAYVEQYISAVPTTDEVAFTWQGGEPTLLGLDFFRRAVELQARHGQGRRISNSFQTNGLLLDKTWCAFLRERDFLVGLSLDGPADLHDEYRRDAGGGPTHESAMKALRQLQQRNVRHNVLACVNRRSAREPLRVYEFFHDAGAEYLQFLPVVERRPGAGDAAAGLRLHGPGDDPGAAVTEWSVRPEEYGTFLADIFDLWLKLDVGRTFVMNFEWALANFLGRPGAVCHHRPTCGRSVVVEHNGDVYRCDHYVYPEHRLGNLSERSFADMVDDPAQERFGRAKFEGLPGPCRRCPVLRGCWGGCPKHRFMKTGDGEPGLNYLCPGFRHFLGHVGPYLKVMADLLAAGRPAADIMKAELIPPAPR